MNIPITNGTPHVEEDTVNTTVDTKGKTELKSSKLMNSFHEMRAGFSEELDSFLSSGNVDPLKQKWSSYQAKDVTKRVSMEQALKDKLVLVLKNATDKNHVKELEKFLQSALVLCTNELITVLIFVNILSDIVDTSTLNVCEELFGFVEANLSAWKSSTFFAPGKNNILRMCNDLLRRLSKAQNTVFCGRIIIFLAMFFPFSERSGLNIISDFNSDVLYTMEDEESSLSDAVEIVDVSTKIDEDFHSKFWKIQEFFRNPNLCYNEAKWKEFTGVSDTILNVFKQHRLNRDSADRISNSHKSEFFTKFLTSRKLLVLQLSDSNLRRTVCLQYLFLFQYLTGHIKTKPENQELSEEEQDWVKESSEKIYSLLRESPPDGEMFVTIARNMVKREEDWSSWKNEGCPGLKKVSEERPVRQSTVRDSLSSKSFSQLAAQSASRFDTIFVPTKDGGPPQSVSLKHSFDDYIAALTPAPELQDFLSDAIEEAEKKMDPEKKRVADPSFAWLSVKLISLKAPTFFSNSHSAVPSMSEYVDIMCKKLYRDLNPGLLLPPYMPAPKTVPKKQPGAAKGDGVAPKSATKTNKGETAHDKTSVKVIKGGIVKVVKAGQPTKILKEGENESSDKSNKSEENSNDSKSEKSKSIASSKSVGKSTEKSVEKKKTEKSSGEDKDTFTRPHDPPSGKSERHRSEKVRSKSPSPKPGEGGSKRKSEDRDEEKTTMRKEEKRGGTGGEKRSRGERAEEEEPVKREKVRSKSPSPKPSGGGKRKSEERERPGRDEEKATMRREEKRGGTGEKRSRGERAEEEKPLPASSSSSSDSSEVDRSAPPRRTSPGKRKASSPRPIEHQSTKLIKVEENKPKDEITKEQIHDLAKSIASDWKKVAERLGYKEDGILLFEAEESSDFHRALNLLLGWVSDEEDATKEALRKHLHHLGLTNAVSILSK